MNKKLLKSIVCIELGIGFVASIPFATSSCSWSASSILPDTVYKYDEADPNKILGFTDEFLVNPTAYERYNTMEIPAKVTSVGVSAFFKILVTTIPLFIKNLTFAEGSNCKTIGNSAFRDSSSLTSINFPSSINEIGNNAFEKCSKLTSITFPDNLSTIHSAAFKNCSSLTSASFPSSLQSIDANAFYNCSNLSSITWNLPTKYQSSITIASYAFAEISLTGTVTSLDTSVASSQQLLEWIKTKGDFPSGDGWKVAD